jgi:hypothetical protein
MFRKELSKIEAPFWSRIPLFGVQVYPKKTSAQLIFWIRAVAYSAIYFYIIAFAVVVFVDSLWVWPGLHNYLTTTLYDICYRNWWLFSVFVIVETILIYRAAGIKLSKVRRSRREKLDWYRLLTQSFFFVALLYVTLKVLTGNLALEPNLTPVLLWAYVVSVGAFYTVDKYS